MELAALGLRLQWSQPEERTVVTTHDVIDELRRPSKSLLAAAPKALSVALLIDGGSATVFGPRAWNAVEEFAPAGPVAVC